MKSQKVSTRLTMNFFIVISLTVLVGLAGVIGMVQINRGSMEMYESQSQPLADLGMAREYFQRLRVQLRDIVLASGNLEALAVIEADMIDQEHGFLKNMESYRQTIDDPSMIELYDDIMFIFAAYQPSMQQIIASARVHAPPVQMILMMDDLVVPTDFIMEALDYLAYARVRQAAHANEVNRMLFNVLFIMIAVVIVICVGVGIFIVKNVSVLSKMELDRLADENAALESLSRMKSKYLADMSHEIKTPLTVILGDVQRTARLIKKGDTTDERIEKSLTRAKQEVMRISRLTKSAISMAALQETREKMSHLDAAQLFVATTEGYRSMIEKQGNILRVYAQPNLPKVFGNADQLIGVLFNLLDNANKHTKKSDIAVNIELRDDAIEVMVADGGEGIEIKVLETVFERGVSGSGSTGMGLAICKDIVRAHGGEIGIESTLGRGTAVTFWVPVADEGEVDGDEEHTFG